MSSADTVSDSQLSNVSLELSQETMNRVFNAVGVGTASDGGVLMEEFQTELEGEEEEEEESYQLTISRAIVQSQGMIPQDTTHPQLYSSPPPPHSSTALTPTNTSHSSSWTAASYADENGQVSPIIINSPTPPPLPPPPPPSAGSYSISPLSHLPPSDSNNVFRSSSSPPPPPPPPHPQYLLRQQSSIAKYQINKPESGGCGFEIALDVPHPYSSRTPNCLFSQASQKMYIKQNVDIPLSFTILSVENRENYFLQVMAIHKQPEMIGESLKCCVKHREEELRKGQLHPFHFVKSSMNGCIYFGDPNATDQRLFLRLPISSLQRSGDSLYTAVLRFPCFTSDFKRPGQLVQLIFTLEDSNLCPLGRAVLDIRVCASPGRDYEVNEKRRGSDGGGGGIERETRRKSRKRNATSMSEEPGATTSVTEEVKQCTFPPVPPTRLSRNRMTYQIETYPELIDYIRQFVKMAEAIHRIPLTIPPPATSPPPSRLMHQDSFPTLEKWLDGLGLSRCLSVFKSRGIGDTFQVLSITESELQTWGLSENCIQRFMKGVAALKGPSPPSSTTLPPTSSSCSSSQALTLSQLSSASTSAAMAAGTQSFEVLKIQASTKRRRQNSTNSH